jgi:dipeptidyl aminopeptidase/acylaminoacyl peptidase
LDIQGELERSIIPNKEVTTNQVQENATQIYTEKSIEETQAKDAQSTQNITNASSLEYAVTKVKQYKFWYLAFAVLLIAGIGFGIYRYSGNPPINISFESAKITKVTDSGKVGRAAISPDGKWLVYSVIDGEKSSLWLKQVAIPDSNAQIVPPADVRYRELSFSPDGNYLYYTVVPAGANSRTLYQMPVLGGNVRSLISSITGGISFSPDGKQITYGVEDQENDESILMIANADGTEPRQLTKRKGNDEIASSKGRWSPDGKSILLWTGTNNPRNWNLATVSVATGEITQFGKHKFDNYQVWEWLPDGKSMLMLANENVAQNWQFWQISYPSGEAKKVSNDLNLYNGISLTADANILATVQTVL